MSESVSAHEMTKILSEPYEVGTPAITSGAPRSVLTSFISLNKESQINKDQIVSLKYCILVFYNILSVINRWNYSVAITLHLAHSPSLFLFCFFYC